MQTNHTQPKTSWLFATLFLVLPLLSFESKILQLYKTPPANSELEYNKPASPDVKSWSFVKQVVGSRFEDVKAAITQQGYKLDNTEKFSQGTSYYYVNSKSKFNHPVFGETEEEYTVVVKDGKVRGILMDFLIPVDKTYVAMLEKWNPFEKAFLADNYKKMSEDEEDFEITRLYKNTTQHTKLRVTIIKVASIYQAVEVILCDEDLDMDEK